MSNNISKLEHDNIVLLHLVDSKLNKNHLAHWIDVLKDSSINFSCLVRNKKSFKELVVLYPQYQILFASTPLDVEVVVNAQPTLKVVLFPLNASNNIHLIRFNHLKHIFIGTKNSDQLSIINRSYKVYDEIWLSSQFMLDKYNEIFNNTHLKFKMIGKPQIKNILNKNIQYEDRNKILITISKSANNIKNYLSKILSFSQNENISLILEDKKILGDLKNFVQAYSLNTNIVLDTSLLDNLALYSKYIITDIDNISVFYLAYNQPLIVFVPESIDKKSLQLDIPKEALYLFSTMDEFIEIIDNIDKDIKKDQREYYTNYLLGREETLNEVIYEELALL